MRARGSGIHMISHFGWGVRGLGGSEIPVYLSVAELKGKLRVRILLSASPPFAREISFSFVSMPEFNISARPLRSGSFNAMDIPMIKSYVEKSIAKVAGGFVSPKSYTMDVERLLMGQDSQLRAQSVGVFHIIIHNAHNLPRTDTVGSCDPYLAISYSKFNKPRE
jgi:Ca2+-dependent lipid-binding protein